MGERMPGIDDLRGENRQDGGFEIPFRRLTVLFVQIRHTQMTDAMLAQQTHQVVISPVSRFIHGRRGLEDAAQLFRSRHAGFVIGVIRRKHHIIGEAAHPHHEEFV